MRFVKADQLRDVDVGDAVAVGEAERFLIAHMLGHPGQSPAGHGFLAGVHQRHSPWLGLALMYVHGVLFHVEGHIGHVQEVIGEVLLDHIALVSAADHEIVDAMGGIDLHDVPQDRLAADLDHWLGLQVGLFGNSGT